MVFVEGDVAHEGHPVALRELSSLVFRSGKNSRAAERRGSCKSAQLGSSTAMIVGDVTDTCTRHGDHRSGEHVPSSTHERRIFCFF